MTEDQIASKILQDTQAEAEEALRRAAQASVEVTKRQIDQALKDAEKAAAPTLARIKEEAEAARRQVLTEAQSRANWSLLAERRKIIEEALTSAGMVLTQNLRSDPERYVKLLSHLAQEGAVALGGGELEILLNSHDARMKLNLGVVASEVERQTGVKTTIRVSNRRSTKIGGVLVQADEGRRIIDNTFEGIMERRRRDLEVKASNLLFVS